MALVNELALEFKGVPIPSTSNFPIKSVHTQYQTVLKYKDKVQKFTLYFVKPMRDAILRHLVECAYIVNIKFIDFTTLYDLEADKPDTKFLYNYMLNNGRKMRELFGMRGIALLRESLGIEGRPEVALLDNKKVEILGQVDSNHYKVRIFNGTKQLTSTVTAKNPNDLTPLLTIIRLLHEALDTFYGGMGSKSGLRKLDRLLGDELFVYYQYMREEYIKKGIPHPSSYRVKGGVSWDY